MLAGGTVPVHTVTSAPVVPDALDVHAVRVAAVAPGLGEGVAVLSALERLLEHVHALEPVLKSRNGK